MNGQADGAAWMHPEGRVLMDTTPDEDPELGSTIALRALMATIRRKKRVWLITGLLGLIIGASLHWVIPPKYSAVTDLYLATPDGSNPTEAMANNVSLAETQAVARQAISSGHLSTTPHALLSHYTGLSVSDNIMSIRYSGSSETAAVSGARAVAKAYLAVQARELRLQTDALDRGLQSQISSLNTQISGLNTQINDLSGAVANTQTGSQLTELVNQRGLDQSQVSQLEAQIQQALLNEHSSDVVNNVLDPAALVPVSLKKVVSVDALSGLIAGLAIGLAAVIISALFAEKSPDRSVVAATLGAPVELSLGHYRGPRRRRQMSRQLREPDPSVRMIERRLRVHLESAPGSALAVVAVGTTEPAVLAVGALAFSLASEGRRVVVVDAANDRLLAAILGLKFKPDRMEISELPTTHGPPLRVLVAPQDPVQMAQKPLPDDVDALLVLATLDPAFGAEHLAPWVTDAVVVLSPLGVTLTQMDVSRKMLREAGISLRSVFLLDSDPGDESSGAVSPIDLRLTPLDRAEMST
jgi:capsular polysaccharide biosynthesis protein